MLASLTVGEELIPSRDKTRTATDLYRSKTKCGILAGYLICMGS